MNESNSDPTILTTNRPNSGLLSFISRLGYLSDVKGTPLFELNAPYELRQEVNFDKQNCPYPGSRHGKPMLTRPLLEIAASREPLFEAFGSLAQLYSTEIVKGDINDRRGFIEGVVNLAKALPYYLSERPENSYNSMGELPVVVADMYKASVGLKQVLKHMRYGGIQIEHVSSAGNKVAQFAEEFGFLVGSATVCVAPEALIIDTVNSIVNYQNNPSSSNPIQGVLTKHEVVSLHSYGTHRYLFESVYLDLKKKLFQQVDSIVMAISLPKELLPREYILENLVCDAEINSEIGLLFTLYNLMQDSIGNKNDEVSPTFYELVKIFI